MNLPLAESFESRDAIAAVSSRQQQSAVPPTAALLRFSWDCFLTAAYSCSALLLLRLLLNGCFLLQQFSSSLLCVGAQYVFRTHEWILYLLRVFILL